MRTPVRSARDGTGKASTISGKEPCLIESARRVLERPMNSTGISSTHRFLMNRLLDSRDKTMAVRPTLANIEQSLVELFSDPIERGQNASAMVIGERGCGKTLAVERAVEHVTSKHNSMTDSPMVGVVRLNGIFHSNDRTAFKEIARQLCGLFALDFVRVASVDENISFMKKSLVELYRGKKTIIFVLDEFDFFAAPQKQRVLYTLLDSLQTSQIQAAVVGVSSRGDVLELLEKRVISRFSHKTFVVLKPMQSEEGASPAEIIRTLLEVPSEFEKAKGFNANVKSVLASEDLQERLESLELRGYTPRDLVEVCSSAISVMQMEGEDRLQVRHFADALDQNEARDDSQVSVIGDLSLPELYILVASHWLVQRDQHPFNFEIVFDAYQKHISMQGTIDRFAKGLMEQAFRDLLALQILINDQQTRASSKPPNFRMVLLNVTAGEISQGLGIHQNVPQPLKNWFQLGATPTY
ncbi:hypothetical protein BSKO_08619 [Bryopsis sp. KO-2023]|nr:hypothetical protein BSKO_08619 [Bryopsis sp. KO-2023]